MKWFRSNLKHGSRLALFALAIQFFMSFGHFHGIAAQAAPGIESGLAEFAASRVVLGGGTDAAQEPRSSNHDTDQQPRDACAICAIISLAHNVLFATPPPLLLPQAVKFSYLNGDAEFIDVNSAHPAFQSRAPPTS
jgi:hypothetical protein